MRLAIGKIEKCKARMGECPEFQKVDPLRSERPIRPISRTDVAQYFPSSPSGSDMRQTPFCSYFE